MFGINHSDIFQIKKNCCCEPCFVGVMSLSDLEILGIRKHRPPLCDAWSSRFKLISAKEEISFIITYNVYFFLLVSWHLRDRWSGHTYLSRLSNICLPAFRVPERMVNKSCEMKIRWKLDFVIW